MADTLDGPTDAPPNAPEVEVTTTPEPAPAPIEAPATPGQRAELQRLAALARLVESMTGHDVRVLAGEVRRGLEALAGPSAVIVPFRRPPSK